MNCYFYTPDPYGLSGSSINAALSARRPIAIRKTKPTLSYWNVNPSICIEENSIKENIDSAAEDTLDSSKVDDIANDVAKGNSDITDDDIDGLNNCETPGT